MATSKTKYIFWFIALITIMACIPSLAAPVVPTLDPNAVVTYIAETAHAASTETARALPTFTPTITFTSTPRSTNTPEPTATATIIFILASPTSMVPTIVTSDKNYACQVLSVTPVNGTTFLSRTDFDAKWKVLNVGKRLWDKGAVDYLYLSGDKFHKVAGYDLPKAVKPGESLDLIVDMLAPKDSGSYTTNWIMQVNGANNFCPMSLTINVK
jgi:Ig-like domain-containing protein